MNLDLRQTIAILCIVKLTNEGSATLKSPLWYSPLLNPRRIYKRDEFLRRFWEECGKDILVFKAT